MKISHAPGLNVFNFKHFIVLREIFRVATIGFLLRCDPHLNNGLSTYAKDRKWFCRRWTKMRSKRDMEQANLLHY